MKIGALDTSFPQSKDVFLWQYANAHYLNALLSGNLDFFKSATFDFFKNWYSDVFNLDTANAFGLEVWGRILGVKRPSSVPQNYVIDNENVFRFKNVNDNSWHSIWLSGNPSKFQIELSPGNESVQGAIPISDSMYRRCLKARLFLLYSNYSVNDINRYLNYLFPNKGVYARDNLNMTMDIVFNYVPSDVELSIITFKDFSPRPAGVWMNYKIDLLSSNTFGFEENKLGTWSGNESMPPVPQGYGTFYDL